MLQVLPLDREVEVAKVGGRGLVMSSNSYSVMLVFPTTKGETGVSAQLCGINGPSSIPFLSSRFMFILRKKSSIHYNMLALCTNLLSFGETIDKLLNNFLHNPVKNSANVI